MVLLDIDRAGRVFGSGHLRVVALDDVSLRVSAGEFVAVMGPSGSGKSTLLRLAGGLDRPTSGRVLLAGRDLAGLDEAGLAQALRRQIGFIFQETNLLASLTAAENVALALELDGVRPKAAMAGARGLLDSLGLAAIGSRFPGLFGLLKGLNGHGTTVVYVTHDPSLAALASRIVSVRDGLITGDTRR